MTEEWRYIPEFFGLYEASSQGRIRSLRSNTVMAHCIDPYGYPRISIKVFGTCRSRSVHRMVAAAFLGDPEGRQVNHKDANKQNNIVDNLEYVTNDENIAHGVRLGLFPKGAANAAAKLTDSLVNEIRKAYVFGSHAAGTRALARKFGMSQYAIQCVVSGKSWTHLGDEAKL